MGSRRPTPYGETEAQSGVSRTRAGGARLPSPARAPSAGIPAAALEKEGPAGRVRSRLRGGGHVLPPLSGHSGVVSGVTPGAGFRGREPFGGLDGPPVSRARAPIQVRPRWPGFFSAFRAQGLQLH